MNIKHKRRIDFPDDPNHPEMLNPSDWNDDEHEVTGGATGSFVSQDGKTVTVVSGIVTEIV